MPKNHHQLSVIINAGMEYDRYCSDDERLALLRIIETFSHPTNSRAAMVSIIMDANLEYDRRCNENECRKLKELLRTFSTTDHQPVRQMCPD